MLAPIAVSAAPTAIMLDDFEAGVGAWQTNDSTVAGTGEVARLCGIYATATRPPEGGAQAAMVDFLPARDAWASVSLRIDGNAWREKQIGQLRMWMRAAERNATVVVALRARVPTLDGRVQDRSYVQELHLSPEAWQRISLRLLGFRTREGDPLDDQTIPHLYLLQFIKTGTWDRGRFYVDDIEARPLTFTQQQSAVEPGADETIIVDMRQQLGRCLGQVGFNLSPDPVDLGGSPAQLRQIATHATGLRPCVGRVKTSHYYDRSQKQFDLFGLNEMINWLTGIGIRPLVCLEVPHDAVEAADQQAVQVQLHSMSAKLAELHRESALPLYYEFSHPSVQRGLTHADELVSDYQRLAAAVQAADTSAAIGGPGLTTVTEALLREFVGGVSPHFFSYHLMLPGPTWPDDNRLAFAAHNGVLSANDWGYEQTARYLARHCPGTEFFITQWGVSRGRTEDAAMRSDQETGEALFLASSALSASRHVDKLLWSGLVDAGAGLLDLHGRPRPSYWAAWLVNTYAPRGATYRAHLPRPANLLITAVTTRTAANVFVINRSPWPTSVRIQVVGLQAPAIVREHRLEPGEADIVQHRNLSRSSTQKLSFQGAGMSVVQFISPPEAR